MSAQVHDPRDTEKAWEEIRQLIDEVARLAQSSIQPKEFYTGLLDRIVAALAGVGGAVWTLEGGGQLELQYQIALDQTNLSLEENRQVHRQLLAAVMQRNEATFVPPHAGISEDGPKLNPSEFLLLLAPLVVEEQVIGVVEIFKRPGGLPSARRGYLRFLSQMCMLAAEYFKNHQLRQLRQRQQVWGEFDNFTRAVHKSLNHRETAYVIANEGRRFMEADRVSVAITRGRKSWVEAVSGQDLLNRRSNAVRMLDRLTSTVVRTGEAFYYTEDSKDIAPQIERVLTEYVDDSHAKAIAVIPLRKPEEKPDPSKQGEERPKRPEIIGALIVERFEHGKFDASMQQRIDAVCVHSSTALNNSLSHSRIFLLPLWKAIGNATWLVRARTLPKTLAVVAAIAAVVYLMAFVPYEFALEGRGTLEPEFKRDVFAEIDGDVKDVLVEHGDMVKGPQPGVSAGTPGELGTTLVILDSREIAIRLDEVRGKLQTSLAELQSVQRRRQTAPSTEQERQESQQLAAKESELQISTKSLQSQEALLIEQEKQLIVRAPIDGQVITWNARQQLAARPVQRGQVLMTIADLSRPWVLEVLMPEDRMGHILEAQSKLPPGEQMTVSFILATDPGVTFEGKVRKFAMAANMQEEEGNCVLLTVDFDRTKLPKLRPGAAVTAKVHCGQKAFGYVWFHDVIEFVQSKVLFRL